MCQKSALITDVLPPLYNVGLYTAKIFGCVYTLYNGGKTSVQKLTQFTVSKT